MTTYSNLGIKLMETGAESGTWGASTNTNFEYFDTAIVGFVSVALTVPGTTSAPNVLDVADFAESTGRNRIISFTSPAPMPSTAYVRITPNDFKGYYFIKNSVSGGANLVVFQGVYDSVRSYTVPNGKDVIVKCNGAGDISSVIHIFNNVYNNSIQTNSFTTNLFTANSLTASNISATSGFTGPGTGLTGTANGLTVNYTNTATTATASNSSLITLSADNVTYYPTWVTGVSGSLPIKVSNTKINENPSTARLGVINVVTGAVTNSLSSTISGTLTTTNLTVSDSTPTFSGVGALKIPVGTTAQQPSGPNVGMVRFNSTTGNYEVYTSTGWQNLALGAVPTGNGLGINQTWQNLIGSRAVGSYYTNNAGAPIHVMVTLQGGNTTARNYFYGYNDGWNMVYQDVNEPAAGIVYVRNIVCWSTIVPYRVNPSGTPVVQYGVTVGSGALTLLYWYELR